MQNIIKADTYEYLNKNWEDQLTKFNNELISYDQIGNLIRIGNKKLSWINGRELKSYQDENQIIEYKYNKDGIRTKKTINGKTTEYYLQGNKIIVEKTEDNMLYYLYNSSSSIIGFIYNGNNYYYLKNLQNDIIGILDNNLELVVTYEYDEWGSIISITDANGNQITDENHIANINPFRYRGYYYDQESKLYYLNSRYYNPEWKRFINADTVLGMNNDHIGYNLFAYVSNNPINRVDSEGNFPNLFKSIAKAVNKVVTNLVKTVTTIIVKTTNVAKTTINTTASITNKVVSTTSKIITKVASTVSKGSFIIEGGFGVGAGLNGSIMDIDTGASYYQDITYTLKNKELSINITGNANMNILGFGASKNFEHDYPFDINESGWKHSPLDTTLIPKCKNTTSKYSFDTPISSFTNKSIFLGIELDLHFGIGGHFKIGWEIDY